MKFSRRFYNSKINFNSISRKRIVLSILLGLISALVIYSFFYVFRENFRMMNLDFENRPIKVSEVNRNFHNLFFAAISLIFGNSIAIFFLISRPQSIISKRNIKRSRILNDQIFLSFNFIYWFSKIWFFIGVFSFLTVGFDYVESLMVPGFLLVIVLYLESWKTLIQVIKKNRFRIQLLHFLTFVVLTFGLSKIDVFDYKFFDKLIEKKNPSIEVPKSSYRDNYFSRGYYADLVFKLDFETNNEITLYNFNNEKIEYQDINKTIEDWKKYYVGDYSPFSIRLRANKDIPLRAIKKFEFELLTYNHFGIIYEVVNNDESTAHFHNHQLSFGISLSLNEYFKINGNPPKPLGWEWGKQTQYSDTIHVHISNKIFVNNIETSLNSLSQEFKKDINSSTIFEFIYHDKLTYQDFIYVLSEYKKTVYELRETENFNNINEQYYKNQFNRDEILNKERQRIIDKYPFRITERFN